MQNGIQMELTLKGNYNNNNNNNNNNSKKIAIKGRSFNHY